MFASLKNKIKEETGSDLVNAKRRGTGFPNLLPHQRGLNYNSNNSNCHSFSRSQISSTVSVNSNSLDDHSHNDQLFTLRQQCRDLVSEAADLQNNVDFLQEEKLRLEKTNGILLESVKVAQTQKDIYCEEQEKIQNIQQLEIEKLRNLLAFREQEAVDRLGSLQQTQHQVENLTAELERLQQCEQELECLRDELEQLRHSMQLEKNNLTITLAATEEENCHLKMRLQIVEKSRLETLNSLQPSEKLEALIQEHKLLEQHLEETHLQLSDIKSSWSGQNLALETQVNRLSKQVAEETTEKRKYQKMHNDLNECLKQVEIDLIKTKGNIKHRDDKIKLLEEEIDELNLSLNECRKHSEEQVLRERSKSDQLQQENSQLKDELQAANKRLSEKSVETGKIIKCLEEELFDMQISLEQEKEEKLTALLKNAEISQSEELLRKELRNERDETNELHDKKNKLEMELKALKSELNEYKRTLEELKSILYKNESKLKEIDELQKEIAEKNKMIKTLNQRLADLKKTLQREFCNKKTVDNISSVKDVCKNHQSKFCPTCGSLERGDIIMDDVNFRYLKHVIVKFLTSREVEARHLIRAVATLLKLTNEEEKLLHDTLNWKMSWFGSKPNHGSGQHSFSIPPS